MTPKLLGISINKSIELMLRDIEIYNQDLSIINELQDGLCIETAFELIEVSKSLVSMLESDKTFKLDKALLFVFYEQLDILHELLSNIGERQ